MNEINEELAYLTAMSNVKMEESGEIKKRESEGKEVRKDQREGSRQMDR